MPNQITAPELRELVNYDPETGVFTWAKNRKKCTKGAEAGSVASHGYITIRLNYSRYYAHRLAWLYVHGVWPPREIDHRNGDPSDNRIANIRAAEPWQNQANRDRPKNNSSGFVGVRPSGDKFYAMLQHRRQTVYCGTFDNADEAAAARDQKAKELNGDFARLGA